MSEKKYWVRADDNREGPYTLSEIKTFSGYKKLWLRCEGTAEWLPALAIEALKGPPPEGKPLAKMMTEDRFKLIPNHEKRSTTILINGTKEECELVKEWFPELCSSRIFTVREETDYSYGFYFDSIEREDIRQVAKFIRTHVGK